MSQKITFHTDFEYTDRETKQKYVALKYAPILQGKVLDVGADQMYLQKYLEEGIEEYVGVGIEGSDDLIKLDLEKDKLPFEDQKFNCVLCLDVLEHVENNHEVFGELCRVSSEWVIVSLPNPYQSFIRFMENGEYAAGRNIKYYGLTKQREPDRHKWFFSSREAREFVEYLAQQNGFEIYDLFTQLAGDQGLPADASKAAEVKAARKLLFSDTIDFSELYEGTQWWVLRRK